jgi:hypothetical protein
MRRIRARRAVGDDTQGFIVFKSGGGGVGRWQQGLGGRLLLLLLLLVVTILAEFVRESNEVVPEGVRVFSAEKRC